jgi:hypothetical protein
MERKSRISISKQLKARLVAVFLICNFLLVGCKGEEQMSQAEKENFNGGPMPAGFMEKNAPPQGPPK